jgi:hypothetical protein
MADGKKPKLTISANESRSLPMQEYDLNPGSKAIKKIKYRCQKNGIGCNYQIILKGKHYTYTAAKQICTCYGIRKVFFYSSLHNGYEGIIIF